MSIGSFLDRVAGAKEPKRPERKRVDTEPAAVRVPSKRPKISFPLTKAAFVIVLIGVSFYAGAAYEQGRVQASASNSLGLNQSQSNSSQNQNGGTNGGNMGNGGFGGGFGGGYGRFGGAGISTEQVTAISSSSITVQDSNNNSQTYSITSDTLIVDSGQQVSASDIQTGDSVIVIPSRQDTSTARRIIVNPDFGNQNDQPPVDPGETEFN